MKPEIKKITPPIAVGHPVYHKHDKENHLVVVALDGPYAWVKFQDDNGYPPETCALADLITLLPDVEAVELTQDQMDAHIQRAKLTQVQRLIHVIARNDPKALDEMIHRLKLAYKGRIQMGPKDDATPEQMAQGLLVSVLIAGLEVQP